MAESGTNGWDRREMLGGAALLALFIGLPVAAIKLDGLSTDEVPSERQRLLMSRVAQLVIPRTATPGGGDVGAGDFTLLALAHRLSGSGEVVSSGTIPHVADHLRYDGSLRHVDWLESELDRRSNGNFLRKGIDQARILGNLDVEAYAGDMEKHPWRTIKTLILTGYYTSQAGGSQELRYEPVPGRWEPDLSVTPETRAISNDWTAVDFG